MLGKPAPAGNACVGMHVFRGHLVGTAASSSAAGLLQAKRFQWDLNPGPSYCEATPLTTGKSIKDVQNMCAYIFMNTI